MKKKLIEDKTDGGIEVVSKHCPLVDHSVMIKMRRTDVSTCRNYAHGICMKIHSPTQPHKKYIA